MMILLFTVVVIAMSVLVMYKKDKNVLRRMMARGRCGLPGLPNLKFYKKPSLLGEDECQMDDEGKPLLNKDPFDAQLKTLAKVIEEKRKQISDSKDRVTAAEQSMRNLHITSITIRRQYMSIMDDLKGELESAEIECQELNKHLAKANVLKQKFFSQDDDDCGGNNFPTLPSTVKQDQWGSLPLCSEKPQKKQKYTCHPPVKFPCGQSSPTSCKCPSAQRNPLSTCTPPLPNCCPDKRTSKPNCSNCGPGGSNCGTNSSKCGTGGSNCGTGKTRSSSTSLTVTQFRSNPSVNSCCTTPLPPSIPNPCPAPLPSLLPRKFSSNCNTALNEPKSNSSLNGNRVCPQTCCQTNENKSQNCNQNFPPRRGPQGCPPCPPCPPPDCMCECPEEEVPPPRVYGKYVRKPPFSSFFQERLPSQPLQRRSFKQTVVTEECIEGDEDETSSWLEPNTVVTEVMTSSVTFPPNCCVSVYEEFLNAAFQAQPKQHVKLPVIIDECDPCAEIPREISPFEDTENVTHTCGTQTKEEEEEQPKNKKKSNR